jgi:hypothetical protein
MLKRAAVLALVALPACGGGSNGGSPVAPSTPVPTPTPISYSGTFSGPMCTTGAGVACLTVTGRTTATHTGNALSFNNLTVTGVVAGTFGGASGVLNGNTFTLNGSYTAQCGTVGTTYTGFFSGDGRLMNLRVNLEGCASLQFLGELSK